jgi:O-antigen/teichoic acid export membrane protein
MTWRRLPAWPSADARGLLAVAVFGSVFASPLMHLRYAEHTELSSPAFAVLIWCFVAVSTTYVFGTLLTAAGDLKALNWMAACGMALNIGLNLVFIPRWQAMGAAWASLITQSLTALVQVFIAGRRFSLRPSIASVLRTGIYLGGLMGLAFFARSSGLPLLPTLAGLLLAMLLWSLASGMIGVRSIRAVLTATEKG